MASTTHTGLEVTGLAQFNEQLERLMRFDPTFEKRLQKVIDQTLIAVRKGVISDAKTQLPNDPRGAARAVRRVVYRQILGGQINILKKRRASRLIGEDKVGVPNGKQWWRRRGYKTGQMMRYQGVDRGFVLRFMNAGTDSRVSTTMDAHPIKRKSTAERPEFHNRRTGERFKSDIIGNRGRMGLSGGRNFFNDTKGIMEGEMGTLEQAVATLITEEFNR